MNDAEFLEVAPQFLGISFVLGLVTIATNNVLSLYLALFIIVSLALRLSFLFYIGQLISNTVRFIGKYFLILVLCSLYFFFISPYAFLYRMLEKKTVKKFQVGNTTTTSYIPVCTVYDKAFFEKPW